MQRNAMGKLIFNTQWPFVFRRMAANDMSVASTYRFGAAVQMGVFESIVREVLHPVSKFLS